ncbi:MAG: hypothetical protein JNK75_10885 [Betaproteobacteria bacterium]|nr:hypothetical protein [Betaproteobacteria bacterium]
MMRPAMFRRLVLCIGLLPGAIAMAAEPAKAAAARPAEPVATSGLTGTLFLSEAERVRLVRQRQTGSSDPDAPAADSASVITGFVRREGAGTTVWVDGRLVGDVDAVLAQRIDGSMVGNPSGTRLLSSGTVAVREKAGSKAAEKAPPRKPARKKRGS